MTEDAATDSATPPPAPAPAPAPVPTPAGEGSKRGPMRRLYDWVLALSRRPTAERALGVLSFAESMIFPIPPDVMLVPMCVAEPRKALRFATICSITSVLGGMAGYALGMFFWDALGPWFFANIHGFTPERFETIGGWFERWNFWIVFAAGFSPIPYKIFTVSAGVFSITFPMFVLASAISRSARFFLVAALLRKYGPDAQAMIEKHFNLFAIAFVVLLFAGFWVVTQI